MKFCETHKDGRIASTTMCYQRYWDSDFGPWDGNDKCVITEWVEKSKYEVNDALGFPDFIELKPVAGTYEEVPDGIEIVEVGE